MQVEIVSTQKLILLFLNILLLRDKLRVPHKYVIQRRCIWERKSLLYNTEVMVLANIDLR
jgi:hypothetical protein